MVRKLIASSHVFGSIDAPKGVKEYNDLANVSGGIGILIFFTRFIQLIFVIAGIWVIYNVISAGFIYLGAQGDAKAHTQVKDQITMSVVGLLIIVASYGFAALIGLIFFGDSTFILNPVIQGL